ncbi:MAG TPA: hypothetical protein VMR45_02615 [Patescibacteria group bacterium]|nr:hypothetical protein [Patescibacteria group bacterium]
MEQRPTLALEQFSRQMDQQSFVNDLLANEDPQRALAEVLTVDAEGLLAAHGPNVRSYQIEDGTVVDEVNLVNKLTRSSHRPTRDNMHTPGRRVRELNAYVLTRETTPGADTRYSLAYPASTVHHPHNVMGKFERQTILSWGSAGNNLEPANRDLCVLAYHARCMKAAESWNPDTTMIIQGLEGDRLAKKSILGRLGAVAAKLHMKWGEREPIFGDD